MFRTVVIFCALLLVAGAVLGAILHPRYWFICAEGGLFGALVVVGLFFDRYRKAVRSNAHWEKTGERFRDPVSGRMVEVRYNPSTGERDYRET